MSLRFFRRIRIAPGFTLNLSKRGASVSVGVRGAHVTIGTHGTRETVGLPGTGVFYTATQGVRRARKFRGAATIPPSAATPASSNGFAATVVLLLVLAAIFGLVYGLATG